MAPTTISICRWCGLSHGMLCPAVKAIEFHEDGVTIKRVEFKVATDYPSASEPFTIRFGESR